MSKSNKKSNKFSEIAFDKSIVFTIFCFQIKFKFLNWLNKQAAESTIYFVCVLVVEIFSSFRDMVHSENKDENY